MKEKVYSHKHDRYGDQWSIKLYKYYLSLHVNYIKKYVEVAFQQLIEQLTISFFRL